MTSPPCQSYLGFIDASSRALPSSVLSQLRKCSPYPNSDHEDPFPAISSPTFLPPFTLYRRVDCVYGLVQHKLLANRNIREKEVLGFVGGHLQTVEESKKEGVDKGHPSHILIDRGYLYKYYEYKGAESVVLSMKRYQHSLQFIRDPSLFLSDAEEVRPELEAYNVNVDVAFDSAHHLPVLIAYAWLPIAAGTELFAFLSLGAWYSRDHKRLFIASRVSHWYHRAVTDLERLLTQKGIAFTDGERRRANRRSRPRTGRWNSRGNRRGRGGRLRTRREPGGSG